jgi:hypothetical protein
MEIPCSFLQITLPSVNKVMTVFVATLSVMFPSGREIVLGYQRRFLSFKIKFKLKVSDTDRKFRGLGSNALASPASWLPLPVNHVGKFVFAMNTARRLPMRKYRQKGNIEWETSSGGDHKGRPYGEHQRTVILK